jgi:hypothetical protein
MSTSPQATAIETLRTMDSAERVKAVVDLASSLPSQEKKDVAKALRLPDPDNPTTNYLWRVVVTAFVLVMAGSFYVLAHRVLEGISKADTNLYANPELILSVFNAVVGFLAGLFVQSPAKG